MKLKTVSRDAIDRKHSHRGPNPENVETKPTVNNEKSGIAWIKLIDKHESFLNSSTKCVLKSWGCRLYGWFCN